MKGVSDQPQPAKHMQRQVLGWMCIGTANTLESMVNGNFANTNGSPQDYLNGKEFLIWQTVKTDIINCERRLRVLGKHLLGKANYGGH